MYKQIFNYYFKVANIKKKYYQWSFEYHFLNLSYSFYMQISNYHFSNIVYPLTYYNFSTFIFVILQSIIFIF